MVKSFRPLNLTEALEIRSRENTTVFAGGSDLMVRHRVWSGVIPNFPQPLLFIGHLPELQNIRIENNLLKIGAACTLEQILRDPKIPEYLKLPVSQMASPAIRNLATLGGNICNASPAGDTLPMLYALDAQLILKSKNKTTAVNVKDFITGPGQNILQGDEIAVEIVIPLADYNQFYYRKVGSRKANCISKLSFFGLAKMEAGQVQAVRIAFGAVAPTVVRSTEAESLLEGVRKPHFSALLPELAGAYTPLINPIDDVRSTKKYRRTVSLRLLEHFLLKELGK
jgi:CO/xanthine dehydrogenase FAD-binding subunit